MKIVDTKELCEILGVSRTTIHRYMKDGLPYIKKRNLVRFDLDDVEKHLKGEKVVYKKTKKKKEKEVDQEFINLCKDIIEHLNKLTNKKKGFSYKTKKTQSLIKSRIDDGYNLDDFILVIEYQVYKWLNDKKMNTYLTPDTLFGNKFEKYLVNANSELEQREIDQNKWDEALKSFNI